jgi:hypothetical protein
MQYLGYEDHSRNISNVVGYSIYMIISKYYSDPKEGKTSPTVSRTKPAPWYQSTQSGICPRPRPRLIPKYACPSPKRRGYAQSLKNRSAIKERFRDDGMNDLFSAAGAGAVRAAVAYY